MSKCVAAPGEATLAKRANWQGGEVTGQKGKLAMRRGNWPGEASGRRRGKWPEGETTGKEERQLARGGNCQRVNKWKIITGLTPTPPLRCVMFVMFHVTLKT